MENKKRNYNKEILYKVYLEMKKDACEGLKYMESLKEEIWGENDENCKIVVSIAEGSMVSKYQIIIPDKNIYETLEVNVSESLDRYYNILPICDPSTLKN